MNTTIVDRKRTARKGRNQKRKLVTLLSALRNGPYQPDDDGWDHPTRINNCLAAIGAGFSDRVLPLACVTLDCIAQSNPDTVRGVMYAVVSAGWLPDTSKKSYRRVQRILNILRKRRVIPFSWIVDNIRSTEKPSSWSGLQDFAETVRDAYRRDFWASLPDYVCIIVEKDSAAGRIVSVTREYDVPLHPLRGYSSSSFAYVIGEGWRDIEKPIHCYYVGDHDPSGRGIEADIKRNIAEYSGRSFTWTRLAIEPHQFEEYKFIPLAPKRKDTRYRKFTELYGDRCAEVEAVPADALRDMVRDAIELHIPAGAWQRLKEIEDAERNQWNAVMGQLKGVA